MQYMAQCEITSSNRKTKIVCIIEISIQMTDPKCDKIDQWYDKETGSYTFDLIIKHEGKDYEFEKLTPFTLP